MCGLAGKVIATGGVMPADLLAAMCDRLAHRGPDGAGYYRDAGIALGHRRLAVIDLETGRQPMANEDGTIRVVFNGEIYNYRELREDLVARGHRFRTRSDTEVIVHLYEEMGDAFVDRIRGMFAIAIWDGRSRTLLLARDRVGKKPLYYCALGTGVVFASEIGALLLDPEVGRDVDPEAIDAYLSIHYVPAPLTIYKNIRKLPAGHLLKHTTAGVSIRQYWDIAFDTGAEPRPEAWWRDGLAERLQMAVGERLESDVPLGAFLSGGLDSSLIVSLMARTISEPVTTCTATFDENEHDESKYAREVADRFGCAHHEQPIRPDGLDLPVRMAQVFDEPFADPAAIPNYLIAEAARRSVTVVLTGDGGDELFAGYWRHARPRLEAQVRRALGPASAVLPWIASHVAPENRRAGMLAFGLAPADAYAHKHSGLLFDATLKSALYAPGFAEACRGFDPAAPFRRYYERCPSGDPLRRALYVDFKTSLPDAMLVKLDRTTMAHGLEARSPLLDHRLVEFVSAMPSSLKLRDGGGKYMLAQVAADLLPSTVVGREKHGLTIPLARWLRGPWREIVEDCLFSPVSLSRGLFRREYVDRLWKTHLEGRSLFAHHLWTLVMLELWFRQQERR